MNVVELTGELARVSQVPFTGDLQQLSIAALDPISPPAFAAGIGGGGAGYYHRAPHGPGVMELIL